MDDIKKVIVDARGTLSLRKFAKQLNYSAPTIHEAEKTGVLSKRLALKYSKVTKLPLDFFIR